MINLSENYFRVIKITNTYSAFLNCKLAAVNLGRCWDQHFVMYIREHSRFMAYCKSVSWKCNSKINIRIFPTTIFDITKLQLKIFDHFSWMNDTYYNTSQHHSYNRCNNEKRFSDLSLFSRVLVMSFHETIVGNIEKYWRNQNRKTNRKLLIQEFFSYTPNNLRQIEKEIN